MKKHTGSRLSWDEYFIEVAKAVSLRADCTRSSVGAVLVDPDHRIVGTGYNGAPPGAPGCLTGSCPRGRLSYEDLPPDSPYENCISIHAEKNAVLYALPEERKGTTLYVTRRPCVDCKEFILAERVTHVVWWSPEYGISSERLFE